MGRRSVWTGLVAAVLLALPLASAAQVQTLKDMQLADVENLKTKFMGLAEAFEESQYDWRPMDGVRSVRDVLALAGAEANLFPSIWGATPPEGLGQGFEGEMARLAAMGKADLITELGEAFDYMSEALSAMSDEARSADGRTFGQAMKNDAGISYAMNDMHEHLGQLIAYARTNHVVPPWSR